MAAVVLLAGIAVVGLVAYNNSPDNPQGKKGQRKSAPVNPAIAQARTAALDFARQPAANYTGSLTTKSGSDIPVDLTVTNSGTTIGKLGSATEKLELLVIGGKTFFKADNAFWKGAGATASRAARYANRWVRIEGGYIGIDPEQQLAPRIISGELLKAADAGKVTAVPTFKNGVSARPITIPQGTVYVSVAAPYRIVHIDADTTQDPGGGLTPATYADESSFDLDVGYLPEAAAQSLFASLKVNVSRLIDAIDSQVDFDLDGSVALAPCTASGCTATATLTNKLRGSDSYVRTDQPIIVEVIIAFTLDARPVRSCTDVITMVANGKARTSCRVTYSLPADGSRHTIRAQVSGFAKALSKADVAGMSADLARQTVGWRVRQAGEAGLPDTSLRNGKYQFAPPASYNPNAGALPQTDGGYTDAVGNLWTQKPAQGLARKQGFTNEWRVKLSDQGLPAWRDAAKESKSKDGWYVNVTPHGDISH